MSEHEFESMDAHLTQLFTDWQPKPNLEDRMIQRLRNTVPRVRRMPWALRLIGASAAVLVLAATGAAVSNWVEDISVAQSKGRDSYVSLMEYNTTHHGRNHAINVESQGISNSPMEAGWTDNYWNLNEALYSRGESPSDGKSDSRYRKFFELSGGDAPVQSELRSVKAGFKLSSNDPFKNLDSDPDVQGLRTAAMATLEHMSEATSSSRSAFVQGGAVNSTDGVVGSIVLGEEKAATNPVNRHLPMFRTLGDLDVATMPETKLSESDSKTGKNQPESTRQRLPVFSSPLDGLDVMVMRGTKEDVNAVEDLIKKLHGTGGSPGGRSGSLPGGGFGGGFGGNFGGEVWGHLSPRNRDQLAQANDAAPGANQKPEPKAPEAVAPRRIIIRTGEVEFEVDSFDNAVANIVKLVQGAKGAFVATINSEKLPNGKVKGSVVVRVPPELLDDLVLNLRKELGKTGELKNQRIGSQDVTKVYTDLESRLKAARTMEERLLRFIKEHKGETKDLLEAQKQLGEWITKIEEMEGELRYYANMVSLSTLTVVLAEKEIRTAAAVTENERVSAGVEVEDVEKAYRAVLQGVTEAKGRVVKSELKQQSAGQFTALLQFEVTPESAGGLRDLLRQLGAVARLEIDRVQQTEGGGAAPKDGKLKRGDTQFLVTLYNLVNVASRETVTIRLATEDVLKTYTNLRDHVLKTMGRVANANQRQTDQKNVTAQLDFDVRRADEAALQNLLGDVGEMLTRSYDRATGDNVTDAKVTYKVEIVPATTIPAREIYVFAVEVQDVEATVASFGSQVEKVKGRDEGPQFALESNGKTTAKAAYEVPLLAAGGFVEKIKNSGTVRINRMTPNRQAPSGKLSTARFEILVSNDLLVHRDEGFTAELRNGLSTSLRVLTLSVRFVVIGLVAILPWILVVAAFVWLVRRTRGSPTSSSTQPGADGR